MRLLVSSVNKLSLLSPLLSADKLYAEESVSQKAEKRLGKIAIIGDDKASREKMKVLAASINMVRRDAYVDMLKPDTTEDELMKRLQTERYHLVLVPWHLYLEWSRTENFFGKTRKSGPAFAAYFADELLPSQFPAQPIGGRSRFILIDMHRTNPKEVRSLLLSLGLDMNRTGIRPLLDSTSPIYCDNWFTEDGMGSRLDRVNSLLHSGDAEWLPRANAIRFCTMALWDFIYSYGPGKGELAQSAASTKPRAYFQLGLNPRVLLLRLCFEMPSWKVTDALEQFWPQGKSQAHFGSILRRYSDLVRIHKIADTNFFEFVIGFYPSESPVKHPDELRTLWIDSVARNLVSEFPYQEPGPEAPWLIKLGDFTKAPAAAVASAVSDEIRLRERKMVEQLADLNQKIRGLKKLVAQKDDAILELKSGGVGTAAPLSPPDAETLLLGFQEKHLEAKQEIDYMEKEILQLQETGGSADRIRFLQKEIQHLQERERNWILSLGKSLQLFKSGRKSTQTEDSSSEAPPKYKRTG